MIRGVRVLPQPEPDDALGAEAQLVPARRPTLESACSGRSAASARREAIDRVGDRCRRCRGATSRARSAASLTV